MSDILKFLHDYPDDISLVMSKARVLEIIAEIERLRAELDAAHERMSKLDFERTAAELERDALGELLREAHRWISGCVPSNQTLLARIDAALKGDDRE